MEEKDELKELVDLCIPILKMLKEKFHPYTSIIINSDGIKVEETKYGLPIKSFDNDKHF